MKKLALTIMMILVLALPAYAQLGDTDNSAFVIQNLGTNNATVTVIFYNESGTGFTPNPILPGPNGTCGDADDIPNPFTLVPMAKQEVNVSFVCGLADGRYSVVIESTEPSAVIANLIGATGAANNPWYNGSYSGFDMGATTVYFPSTQHEFWGWYSLMSIQNVTPAPISADVTIYDETGASVGTKNYPAIPAFSSVHLDLETDPMSLPTLLNGSAKVECSGACVGTDNQTVPGVGLTQSYSAFLGGAQTLYAPSLYFNFWTWDGSLKVQNIGTTATSIDVIYLYGAGLTCDPPAELIQPGQALYHYLPGMWAGWGCNVANVANQIIAAVITSSVEDVVGVVNAANPVSQAQTYSTFDAGANTVGLPVIMNKYYGWDTSFVCQNLDTAATATVIYSYDSGVGCPAGAIYPGCTFTLAPGEAKEVYQPNDLDATLGLYAVTVTSTGAPVACIANETLGANQSGPQGDWSMSYNGFGQ